MIEKLKAAAQKVEAESGEPMVMVMHPELWAKLSIEDRCEIKAALNVLVPSEEKLSELKAMLGEVRFGEDPAAAFWEPNNVYFIRKDSWGLK